MPKINRDLSEYNHLVRWGVLVGVVVAIALIILIGILDIIFLYRTSLIDKWYLWVLLTLAVLFFTGLVCRRYIFFLANYLNKSFLKRFHEIKILGTYEEARPKLFNSQQKIKHAVLLLHGFTTAPPQLNSITQKLENLNITYHVPNILGFGLNSTNLLREVRCEDWFREALDHFDVLKMFAEEVSIVGHSMGGVLATFVAQQRKVKHLILSAPAFYSVPRDQSYKNILFKPIISSIYTWVFPFLPKSIHNGRKTVSDTLDNSIAASTFHYLAVPVNCIKAFFKAQDSIDLAKVKFDSLTLFHGKQDITIDTPKYIDLLRQKNLQFTEYYFENSAHNLFEDYEREKVSEKVGEILSK